MVEHAFRGGKGYWTWVIALLTIIGLGFLAYLKQLDYGLGITGMSHANRQTIIDAIINEQTAAAQPSPVSFTQPSGAPATGGGADQTIRVSSGASSGNFQVVGKSVGEVRSTLSEALNVDSSANALVNGRQVGNDYILQVGDNLEFMKPAGSKG